MAKFCPFTREKVTYMECLDCGNRGYCDENPDKRHIRDYSEEKTPPDDEGGDSDET